MVIGDDLVFLNYGNTYGLMEEMAYYNFDLSAKAFLGKWSHKATVVVHQPKSVNMSNTLLELATEPDMLANYLGIYDQSNAIIFIAEDLSTEEAILKDPKVLKHPQTFVLRVNEEECIFSRPNPYNKLIASLPLNNLPFDHLQPLPMKGYHLKLGTVPFGMDVVGNIDFHSNNPSALNTTGISHLSLWAVADSLQMRYSTIVEKYTHWGWPEEEGYDMQC